MTADPIKLLKPLRFKVENPWSSAPDSLGRSADTKMESIEVGSRVWPSPKVGTNVLWKQESRVVGCRRWSYSNWDGIDD